MIAYFISDLHLHPDKPHLTHAFKESLAWMQAQAQQETDKRLYLLGDIVDAWIGDDDPLPFWQDFKATLLAQHEAGFQVFFLAGNRDFLMGTPFLAAAKVQGLTEPSKIELDGLPCLLMHGDSLCQYDTAYQRFRWFIRQPWLTRLYLALPLSFRSSLAQYLRKRSSQIQAEAKQQNATAFFHRTEIEEDWIEAYLAQYQAQVLVHGHVHRERTRHLAKSGLRCFVLGDWDKQPSILQYRAGQFSFVKPAFVLH